MATRQERIDAFTHQTVPPADLPLELLCEDHVGIMSFRFCADGVVVLGTVWRLADRSKRRSSDGACVDGNRTQLSPLSHGRPLGGADDKMFRLDRTGLNECARARL
jgi:hypothetical protein